MMRVRAAIVGMVVVPSLGIGTANLVGAQTAQHAHLMMELGHGNVVASVAFSPDGRYVLTGSYDHTARLWDATTAKELRRFEGHSDSVTSIAFSPDARCVLTGSQDRSIRLWDISTGKELRRFEGHSGGITSVTTTPVR
jgi:WD40 repeat protein